MTTRRTGLRGQKKQATREALREAALEHGPENVRVNHRESCDQRARRAVRARYPTCSAPLTPALDTADQRAQQRSPQ